MKEIQYQSAHYLSYLWGLIPLLLLSIYAYVQRRRLFRKMFSPENSVLVAPLRSPWRFLLRDLLLLLVLALLIIALARPRILGKAGGSDERLGVENMICLDISNSMLSGDVPPSRLLFARDVIKRLASLRSNDRMGLVVFAGSAFVEIPLTSDLTTLVELISLVEPSMISNQGTNISEALEAARSSFTSPQNITRTITIFTDGEDHEGDPIALAEAYRKDGILINVVGVGSKEGAPVPSQDGDYIRDEEGNIVLSKNNAELGERLAQAGGGKYFSAFRSEQLAKRLAEELQRLPQSRMEAIKDAGYIEKYEAFVWVAFALILLQILILERKNKWFLALNIFKRETE